MAKTVTVSEASRGFSDLINRVRYRGETTILVKGGKPVAKLSPVNSDGITGKELSELWATLPHLPPKEKRAFAADVERARKKLPEVKDKWE